jgi:hypothetical protein
MLSRKWVYEVERCLGTHKFKAFLIACNRRRWDLDELDFWENFEMNFGVKVGK